MPRDDGLFSGDVHAGLKHMREKLLDLTTRNRLLNFKHSARSSVRIIDELPDVLFGRLINQEKSFSFIPVQRLSRQERREYEHDYRQDHGLSQSEDVPEPDVRRVAIMRGFDTSFEMPFPAGDDFPEKHLDDKIQVLLYPEDLEASLNNLYRQARLGTEETGVNFLHLAIGFLEWDDLQRPGQKYQAPLMLLPVQLERGGVDPTTAIRQFTIRQSGEDLRDNLSLAMKLHEMGLSLPPIDNDEGTVKPPETLFTDLSGVLQTKPNWRIKRYVTLSMFQFGKMVMFEDLDPARWNGRLFSHPIVSMFFEGNPRQAGDSANAYEDLDSTEPLGRFPIIEDADSSQHSVLVDTIEGKNLVVEGPPGTGKSQTITNLIAATLNAGKTVLFVSEKMAALEIVKRRLDEAGLGHFCLELHSHKTQKAQIIGDVRRRLELKGKFPHPKKLSSAIERLEATRRQIQAYSKLLIQPWGNLGHSIQEIMAESVRYRLELKCDRELLSGVEIQQPESIGHSDLDDREMALKSFVAAHTRVFGCNSSDGSHPLIGIKCVDLDEMDFPKFWQALDQHIHSAETLIHLITQVPGLSPEERPLTLAAVRALSASSNLLPSPRPAEIPAWFGALADRTKQSAVEDFASEVVQWRKLAEKLDDYLCDPDKPEAEAMQELIDVAARPSAAYLLDVDGAQLIDVMGQAADVITLISQARDGLTKLELTTQINISFDYKGIQSASALINLLANAPHDYLHLRCDELCAGSFNNAISQTERQISSIRKIETALSTQLDLAIAPEVAEIRKLARTLQSAGAFGFLNGDIRRARRSLKSFWVGQKKATKAEKLAGLRRLIDYGEQIDALKQDRNLACALGRDFAALETPVEPLKSVRRWYLDLVSKLGWSDPDGLNLPDKVWSMDSTLIRLVKEQSLDLNSGIAAIPKLLEALSRTSLIHPGPTDAEENLTLLQQQLSDLLDTATRLNELRNQIGLKPEITGANAVIAAELFRERQKARNDLDANRVAQQLLTNDFQGTETDLDSIERALSLVYAIRGMGLPESIVGYLLSRSSADQFTTLNAKLVELDAAHQNCVGGIDAFIEIAELDSPSWLGESFETEQLTKVVARARKVPRDNDSLRNWVDYLALQRELDGLGLEIFSSILQEGKLTPTEDNVIGAFRERLYGAMAQTLLETNDELRAFRSDKFERLRERYVELDQEIMDLQRERIAARVDQREIPAGESSGRVRDLTEHALLDHIKNQSKPRIAVRQIIKRAGNALHAIKPCFMMGPLSVAQYLDPQGIEFDLVVMDEASQMKPEDAMGAIARGKQVVIVGDTKQLPPTSFFDRVFAEDEDAEDAYVAVEGESILEVAASLFQPPRQLSWHYRSRHESLIAFSNDRFYSNELIVFPSPFNSGNSYGVSFHYINEPSYRSGRNRAEAREVAYAAIRHMESGSTDSLGIVAMNKEQADLIDLEIESLMKISPAAEEWRARREFEPLIIKNLENIQGDERDVIFISFTYGPEASGGVVAQRFGPILSPMGWRRLNVLFTRARKRVVAFSSMRPADIAEKPGRIGPGAMRDYIRYAETGELEKVSFTGRSPDSAFEVAVAKRLSIHGYACEAQIGAAGYYIDIGVRNPDQPTEFIAGIECDGAPWHSGKSVRDRDRIRQAVLEGLGWNIVRIWSTDWYRHPEKELERVVNDIEKARLRLQRKREAQQNQFRRANEEDSSKTRAGANDTTEEGEEKPQLGEDVDTEIRPGKRLGISLEEARRALIELREREIRSTFPNSDRSHGLLRNRMIEVFLRFKPTTQDEFLSKIPHNLRSNTDGEEAKVFLGKVFEILEQIVDA